LNKLKSTKINAIFLAIVLVAGTVTLFLPPFMKSAQAEPYYGMENNYDKSYGKDNYKSKDNSVIVKKVNCNNINVNVNGLELNLTSVPFLSGLLASEANEGERGANSYGSGGSYGDKSRSDGDFKFICINNNNNTVIGVDDGDDNGGVTLPPCEECFAALSVQARGFIEDLLAQPGTFELPVPFEDVIIPETVVSLELLCDFLDMNPIEITEAERPLLIGIFDTIISGNTGGNTATATVLVDCLIEAGAIVIVGIVGS